MAGKGVASVLVEVLGDASGATKALKQTEQATQSAQDVTVKSGKKMTSVYAAVAASLAACAKQATALEASTKGVTVIFEDQADVMMEWAETMSAAGLSTAQAAAAATVLGAQLKNAGATTEQMTVITQGLIETATVLAATLGGSATDAVMAMGAAMRGEYDSLERYGITLTADAVATEAARLASEGFTAASEQQAKMVATLSLIQQQATVIMAGAEDQTVTMKQATDHLIASVKNLAAAIGGPLLDVLAPLLEAMATLIDQLVKAIQESELLAEIAEMLSSVLEILADVLETLEPLLDAIVSVLDRVSQALETVIGWVNDAIDAFQRLIGTIHEAIDSLTFWNDTYANSSVPSSMAVTGHGHARTPTTAPRAAASHQTITVNGVANPQVVARELAALMHGATVRTGWQGVKVA